ncbi:serine hydrolase domain-containing protein [Flavobacteriaceae bacterium M23B6Z8]
MEELKAYFQIPGLAIRIQKSDTVIYEDFKGYADVENQVKLSSDVLFPVASLTKVFSAVLVMQLMEEGKISLEDPIHKYIPDSPLPEGVLLKHILSHTSQGPIGKNFYYSSRFGILSQLIENVTNKSFAAVMDRRILQSLKLEHTFLLRDSFQLKQLDVNIAKPYLFEGSLQKGFIDYGYSAAAGLVSNLEDLAKFNTAIDQNILISEASKATMLSPFKEGIPYGYGIFSQQFLNEKLVWAYGQYDCYSSLLLKVPSKDLTFFLLANNNLLGDPARLIYGDLENSLFALSFLKHFVLPKALSETETKDLEIVQQLAKALASSYMARADVKNWNESIHSLETLFTKHPDYHKYADLSLLHTLIFLKDVAFYRELGPFQKFDHLIEEIGQMLLQRDTHNPYLNAYMGNYYDRNDQPEKARVYFKKLVNTRNFSKNWYTNEAKQWLRTYQ